jgi:hypothetical protein
MTDHTARVEKLKDALETPPAKMPLRRHHDDNYWDEVIVDAGPVVLHGSIVPRYKTSGLSGDEWRISARLGVTMAGRVEVEHWFHRMNDLLMHAPGFVYAERRLLGFPDAATMIVRRKTITLCKRSFPTFGDAAMGLFWHVITANEGTAGVEWHHLSDAEELEHCQQVGCAEAPVNFYRLKTIDAAPGCGIMKYDREGQYTWYCARHTRRGDCGLEDADANMVLVRGNGLAREHAADESPSAFGGVVEVKLP